MAEDTGQSAYQILRDTLEGWGIVVGESGSDLASWLWQQQQNLVPDAVIFTELRNREEYKQRFKGMDYWKSRNQTISEGEYIRMEREYRDALEALGPAYAGFTSNDYIAKLMLGGIGKDEVERRIGMAVNYIVNDAPESVKQALRDQYGMTDMEMVAYMLDPKEVEADLQARYNRSQLRAQVKGAAKDVGASLSERQAQEIADRDLGYGRVAMGLAEAMADAASYNRLASISGGSFSTSDAVADSFGLEGATAAKQQKKKLASQERARFSGSSGLGAKSLTTGGLGSQ